MSGKFCVECRSYDDPAIFYLMEDGDMDPPVVKLFDEPEDAAEHAKWYQELHGEIVAEAAVYYEGCLACANAICKSGRFMMCEACCRAANPELFESYPWKDKP